MSVPLPYRKRGPGEPGEPVKPRVALIWMQLSMAQGGGLSCVVIYPGVVVDPDPSGGKGGGVRIGIGIVIGWVGGGESD